jgi:hypothetical protein
MSVVTQLEHTELERAGATELILRRSAVVTVLRGHSTGQWEPELVQAWASFVRRGYVAGGSGGIRPLHIEYQQAFEDEIVEAIGRLDEIGDIIDGEVSPEEALDLIRLLGEH